MTEVPPLEASNVDEVGSRRTKLRMFLVLWSAGALGVMTFLPTIARLLPTTPKPVLPVAWIVALAGIQNVVIVAGASAVVAFLGRSVDLRSPAVEAWAARRAIRPELLRLVGPGLCVGVLGALFATFAAPNLVTYLRGVPLSARVFYGGIVEELVMRGGLMTLLTWTVHRIVQKGRGTLRLGIAAVAIVLSNAVFAIGHVPMLTLNHDPSPRHTVVAIFIIALPWGWLYYRRGFEAAVVAHASFHVVVAAIAAIRG